MKVTNTSRTAHADKSNAAPVADVAAPVADVAAPVADVAAPVADVAAPTTAESILAAVAVLAAIPRPVKGEKQIAELQEAHQSLVDLHTLAVSEATERLQTVVTVAERQTGEQSLAALDKTRCEALEAFWTDFPSKRPAKKIQFNHGTSETTLAEMAVIRSGFLGQGAMKSYPPSEREFSNAVWEVVKQARFVTAEDGTVSDLLATEIAREFALRKAPKVTAHRAVAPPTTADAIKLDALSAGEMQKLLDKMLAIRAAATAGLTE